MYITYSTYGNVCYSGNQYDLKLSRILQSNNCKTNLWLNIQRELRNRNAVGHYLSEEFLIFVFSTSALPCPISFCRGDTAVI